MKYISDMELVFLLETLNTAQEELDGAVDDGWVVTTDIWDQITGSRRMLNAILNSSHIEVTND